MDAVFDILTKLALSPFRSGAAVADPVGTLRAEGLDDSDVSRALGLSESELEEAGKGAWASCDTCLDPGTDGDVEAP